MRTYYAILCLVLLALLFASVVDGQKAQRLEELEQDRDSKIREKNRVEQEKSNVVAKERSVLAELEHIGKQLAAKEREMRIYELNLARCEKEMKQLEEALAEAELRSKETRTLMTKRLRAMYKFGYEGGQLSYLKLLLGADNISDLMSRYKYLSAIAAADRALLDKAIAEKAEIDSKKGEVEARKKRILYYRGESGKIRKQILNKKKVRQDILARLRRSKKHLIETEAELERSVNELENLITQLQSSSQENYEITSLEEQRGRLSWPVSGKIIKNSAPSMKGVTIQARYGADIRCVASGLVEYARWFDGVGFGQMVIVDHRNGYRTLYAHASELLVVEGQAVDKGQPIAKVGDTGSLKGAILYFEIWKGTKAVRTRQWLR